MVVSAATCSRTTHKSSEWNISLHNQLEQVCRAFAHMRDIPGAAHGQQFQHTSSLHAIRGFQANLQRLAELPGASPSWAVGFTTSTSRRSFRWNMEWRADGSLLNMKAAPMDRPLMMKKNLFDQHSSNQRWVSETCSYHSNPLMQARLEEWLKYTEEQIERLTAWERSQKLSQLNIGVNNEQRKIDDALKQIESLEAYISQVSDPDYIKTYVENQITQTEAKIETLNVSLKVREAELKVRQALVDEFIKL